MLHVTPCKLSAEIGFYTLKLSTLLVINEEKGLFSFAKKETFQAFLSRYEKWKMDESLPPSPKKLH